MERDLRRRSGLPRAKSRGDGFSRAGAIALIVALVTLVATAQTPSDSASLKLLLERHQLFELRDAIDGHDAPPLYSGAVAAAFNRVADAERLLTRAAREATTVEAANDAREWLLGLYMVHGRVVEALRLADQMLAAVPSRTDVRDARELFRPFSRSGNQTVGARQPRTIACAAGAAGLVLPVTVNGRTVNWLADTGFSNAALNESEARMLGLTIGGGGRTGDFIGGSVAARTSIAERMQIGGVELRNVQLLVYPDSQPPWNEMPAGRRGALGLPVLVGLGVLEWTSPGTCRVGGGTASGGDRRSNLAFDQGTSIARVQFDNRPLDVVLDTGNQGGTQLWDRFAREFPDLVAQQGKKGTRRVTQIGGAKDVDLVILPSLRLHVGGFDATLARGEVFPKSVGDGQHHGNIGMEVLGQAASVTIDFEAMTLTLR